MKKRQTPFLIEPSITSYLESISDCMALQLPYQNSSSFSLLPLSTNRDTNNPLILQVRILEFLEPSLSPHTHIKSHNSMQHEPHPHLFCYGMNLLRDKHTYYIYKYFLIFVFVLFTLDFFHIINKTIFDVNFDAFLFDYMKKDNYC